MHKSLQTYTFLERKFREKYNGDINFLPKITIFEKITKKHVFCHFSFKTGYKKIEILKIALELFYWLKTSI